MGLDGFLMGLTSASGGPSASAAESAGALSIGGAFGAGGLVAGFEIAGADAGTGRSIAVGHVSRIADPRVVSVLTARILAVGSEGGAVAFDGGSLLITLLVLTDGVAIVIAIAAVAIHWNASLVHGGNIMLRPEKHSANGLSSYVTC